MKWFHFLSLVLLVLVALHATTATTTEDDEAQRRIRRRRRTKRPSKSPTNPTMSPTKRPTTPKPTKRPTKMPTKRPSKNPTPPTNAPTRRRKRPRKTQSPTGEGGPEPFPTCQWATRFPGCQPISPSAANASMEYNVTGCVVIGGSAGLVTFDYLHVLPGGVLILDEGANIQARNIVVEGAMYVGDEPCPISTSVQIGLYGSQSDTFNPNPIAVTYQYYMFSPAYNTSAAGTAFGNKVFAVSAGGNLTMVGRKGNVDYKGVSWTVLSSSIYAGNTSFFVQDSVDWMTGDKIVVGTTEWFPDANEVRTVLSAQGNQIFVDKPFTRNHFGGPILLSEPNAPIKPRFSAAVGLLSRNIRVYSQGATPGSKLPCDAQPWNGSHPVVANCSNVNAFYGGHTVVRAGYTKFRASGVEYFQLGQAGYVGRYSVHFHAVSQDLSVPNPQTAPNTHIKSSSMWDAMTRFVTVHASDGVLVQDNVGYLSIGHGYYLEDGVELYNNFTHNLAIHLRTPMMTSSNYTWNQRNAPGILLNTNGNPSVFGSDYFTPSGFWITNPQNTFVDNYVAGVSVGGAGFWIFPTTAKTCTCYMPGSPCQWTGPTGTMRSNPNSAPLYLFKGNTVVSANYAVQTVSYTTTPPMNTPNQITLYTPFFRMPFLGKNDLLCSQASNVDPWVPGTTNSMLAVIDNITGVFLAPSPGNFAGLWWVTNSFFMDSLGQATSFSNSGDPTGTPAGYYGVFSDSVGIGPYLSQSGGLIGMPGGPIPPSQCDVAHTYCINMTNAYYQAIASPPNQRLVTFYDGPMYMDNLFVQDFYARPSNQALYETDYQSPVSYYQGQCMVSNSGFGWKTGSTFYYPASYQCSRINIVTSNNATKVPTRHVVYGVTDLIGNTQQCNVPQTLLVFADKMPIMNDRDGSLTGLINGTQVTSNPFLNAQWRMTSCQTLGTAMDTPNRYISLLVQQSAVSSGQVCNLMYTDPNEIPSMSRQCTSYSTQDNFGANGQYEFATVLANGSYYLAPSVSSGFVMTLFFQFSLPGDYLDLQVCVGSQMPTITVGRAYTHGYNVTGEYQFIRTYGASISTTYNSTTGILRFKLRETLQPDNSCYPKGSCLLKADNKTCGAVSNAAYTMQSQASLDWTCKNFGNLLPASTVDDSNFAVMLTFNAAGGNCPMPSPIAFSSIPDFQKSVTWKVNPNAGDGCGTCVPTPFNPSTPSVPGNYCPPS